MESTRYRIPIKIKTVATTSPPESLEDTDPDQRLGQWIENDSSASRAPGQNVASLHESEPTQLSMTELVTDLLEVADNLERAKAYADEGDPIGVGVELTLRSLLRVFAKMQIEPMDTSRHQPFDPRYHQAVATAPSHLPEGQIVMENQTGYTVRGELLRPAQVTVSTGVIDTRATLAADTE